MTAPFTSLLTFRSALAAAPQADQIAVDGAAARNCQLTKPPGALGQLEDLAQWLAGWQGTDRPRIAAPQIVIFAGNHGICAQGISAFPAEVTAQMVGNFQGGGAAINQLAKACGARLDVVPLQLDTPTQDFTQGPAMSGAEVVAALTAGWEAVNSATDLLVVGEMGIGNTTSAAAMMQVLRASWMSSRAVWPPIRRQARIRCRPCNVLADERLQPWRAQSRGRGLMASR